MGKSVLIDAPLVFENGIPSRVARSAFLNHVMKEYTFKGEP